MTKHLFIHKFISKSVFLIIGQKKMFYNYFESFVFLTNSYFFAL